jgi:hypothetical protein
MANGMHDWPAVLINVIKTVDKSTGVYKDAFRTRLSKLVGPLQLMTQFICLHEIAIPD